MKTKLNQAALVAVFLCLAGCQTYVGLSVHPQGADAPEFYAPNPIGIVGAEWRHEEITLFCEHRSSIPHIEAGFGLNECGAKVPIF